MTLSTAQGLVAFLILLFWVLVVLIVGIYQIPITQYLSDIEGREEVGAVVVIPLGFLGAVLFTAYSIFVVADDPRVITLSSLGEWVDRNCFIWNSDGSIDNSIFKDLNEPQFIFRWDPRLHGRRIGVYVEE